MARDPLAVLARLRRLEVDRARQTLADRSASEASAERRVGIAAAALREEARAATPTEFAAWIGRGLAQRERAERGVTLAAAASDAARAALAQTRTAEASLAALRDARAAAAKRAGARRDQARLDEFALRRRPDAVE